MKERCLGQSYAGWHSIGSLPWRIRRLRRRLGSRAGPCAIPRDSTQPTLCIWLERVGWQLPFFSDSRPAMTEHPPFARERPSAATARDTSIAWHAWVASAANMWALKTPPTGVALCFARTIPRFSTRSCFFRNFPTRLVWSERIHGDILFFPSPPGRPHTYPAFLRSEWSRRRGDLWRKEAT